MKHASFFKAIFNSQSTAIISFLEANVGLTGFHYLRNSDNLRPLICAGYLVFGPRYLLQHFQSILPLGQLVLARPLGPRQ